MINWTSITEDIIDRFCGTDFWLEVSDDLHYTYYMHIAELTGTNIYDVAWAFIPSNKSEAQDVLYHLDYCQEVTTSDIVGVRWTGDIMTTDELIDYCNGMLDLAADIDDDWGDYED
jgi:hypothetical protein